MKKLKLTVEALRVESFRTDNAQVARGPVNGQALSAGTLCQSCGSNCNSCGCSSIGAACFCTENLSCWCQ